MVLATSEAAWKMTSEANSDVRGPMGVSLVASSDVRGAMGVVLATPEASGGMGSDIRG